MESKLPVYLQQFSVEAKAEIAEAHRQLLIAEKQLFEIQQNFTKLVEDKVKALGHEVRDIVLDITKLTLSRKETK